MTFARRSGNPLPPELGVEAGHWLLRLSDDQADSSDLNMRNEAFLDWLSTSPQHLRAFMETYETYQRIGVLGRRDRCQIDDLLRNRDADVIRIYGKEAPRTEPPTSQRLSQSRHWRALAALVAVATLATLVWTSSLLSAESCSTRVGEQRTCKLEDGSIVYLNTNSVLKVDFSRASRKVELVRGEALFAVEHDTVRPFVVTSKNTSVRAIGTQFNVRSRADGTDVTVVEGVVQVTDDQAHSKRIAAGDTVRVTLEKIAENSGTSVPDAISWRERRLIFRDASLAEAAAEFNRYNKQQIRVDASVAEDKRLTGIFDADHPRSLIVYAQQFDTLSVEQHGSEWLITQRAGN